MIVAYGVVQIGEKFHPCVHIVAEATGETAQVDYVHASAFDSEDLALYKAARMYSILRMVHREVLEKHQFLNEESRNGQTVEE